MCFTKKQERLSYRYIVKVVCIRAVSVRLADAADPRQEVGVPVVQDLGRVAAVVEHHVPGEDRDAVHEARRLSSDPA